jgi:hypothetical protein
LHAVADGGRLGLEFLQALAQVRKFGLLPGDFDFVDLPGLLALMELIVL